MCFLIRWYIYVLKTIQQAAKNVHLNIISNVQIFFLTRIYMLEENTLGILGKSRYKLNEGWANDLNIPMKRSSSTRCL